jgi:hypothetical protein
MVQTVQSAPSRDYHSLFLNIDRLKGKEKFLFCRGLSLEEKKAYVEYCKERDGEMVTGIFRSFEPVGGYVKMTCCAFNGESPVTYEMFDGMEYTVPRYIAKRFESDFQGSGTWYPTNSNILDEQGKPTVVVGKRNRRFGFSSLDFQ